MRDSNAAAIALDAEVASVEAADFVTIGLLVALEGILSADNALVLAVLVLSLPLHQQKQALRYGILGAFAFRILATLFAAYMVQVTWIKLVGAGYLLYLPYHHFTSRSAEQARHSVPAAVPWMGISAFWVTVARVEVTDLVFAIDSILVAVAMSNKLWVVMSGGLLGIVAMRLVIGQLLGVIQKYPALVDGAFVIIAWVGVKLLIEFLHHVDIVAWEIPKWLSLGLIVLIFTAAFVYARHQARRPA